MSECVIINVTDYMEWWAIDARNLGDDDQVKGVGPCHAVAPRWEEGMKL